MVKANDPRPYQRDASKAIGPFRADLTRYPDGMWMVEASIPAASRLAGRDVPPFYVRTYLSEAEARKDFDSLTKEKMKKLMDVS